MDRLEEIKEWQDILIKYQRSGEMIKWLGDDCENLKWCIAEVERLRGLEDIWAQTQQGLPKGEKGK